MLLQFWKRSGQKEKTRSNSTSSLSVPSSPSLLNGEEGRFSFTNVDCSSILASLDDEGLSDIGDAEVSTKPSSRLSKTLSEVLTDKAALGYFIQYLEVQGGLSYVRCWLDIESFRSAALVNNGLCTHNITRDQLEENLDVRFLSPVPSSRLDHDSLSVSTDCDSFTADSNSLYDYSSITLSDARTSSIVDNVKRTNETTSTTKIDNCDKDVSDISNRLHKDTKITDGSDKKECRALLDDALRIFKKYIAQEAPNSIGCSEEVRGKIIESICSEDGVLDPNCFETIQKLVYETMSQQYFNNFFLSHYHCKYQIDVLTSGNIELRDVLYNESILFYFMEYLEQERSRTLLEFWIAATNFKQQLLDSETVPDPEDVQKDAIILYDKYFSLQAICPLGFGDKIRFLIEELICSDGGPQHDCFQQPIKIVEFILDRYYLKPFLSSQLYFKYLSELISTVQTNGCVNNNLRKGTYSDCSSEVSISVHNTLLAMDETNLKNKSLKSKSKTDMSIDTRQLYDPDSLWKRRRSRRLSFGRITELGRFETDVEPEPDRKTESRLTRAMKRFINLEESKTKEEMAWQVAEMIVKDITSITLAEVSDSTQS